MPSAKALTTLNSPPLNSPQSKKIQSNSHGGHIWHRLSMRFRFFAVAGLALVSTVLAIVILQSQLTQRDMTDRAQTQELPAQIRAVAAVIQAQLNVSIAGSEALANNLWIQQWIQAGAPQETLSTLEAIMERTQRSLKASAVFVAAGLPDGQVRYFHYADGKFQNRPLSPQDPTDGWFFGFVQRSNTFELNLDSNPLDQTLFMYVNYRSQESSSRDRNLPVAVAGGGIGMGALADLVHSQRIGESGQVMLVRADGLVDVHPDTKLTGKLNLREQAGFAPLVADDWRAVREQTLAVAETNIDGVPSYVAAMYLPDLQHYLVAHLPAKEITAGAQQAQWLTLAAGAVLMLLGLVVLIPLSASLIQPLSSLQQQLAHITESLNLGTRLHTHDQAEIGRMCQQLNHFIERLHGAFVGVHQSADHLHQSSHEVAQNNHSLAERTQAQSSALAQSAAGMEELASSVQHNADSARQASELTRSTSLLAQQGGSVMEQVVENMHSITQSSQRIGDIVGVIDSIAFQTNILALNAAVEAARAGEQGRGFAVVATEVRALAQRSSSAAHEIRDLILESTSRVRTGMEHVERAGTTMQEIVDAVQKVLTLVQAVALASREQAENLTSLTHATAQAESHNQENTALVSNMAATAQQLSEEAAHLRGLLSAFAL